MTWSKRTGAGSASSPRSPATDRGREADAAQKDSAKPQFIMAEAPQVSSHGTEVDPVPTVLSALYASPAIASGSDQEELMAATSRPGPVGFEPAREPLLDGTTCRQLSPLPGPAGTAVDRLRAAQGGTPLRVSPRHTLRVALDLRRRPLSFA